MMGIMPRSDQRDYSPRVLWAQEIEEEAPVVRRVANEHSALEALFSRALPCLEEGAEGLGTRDAVEELRAALEAHLSAEEDLYFPTVWALRPQFEIRLRSFIRAHQRFRGLLREIAGLVESREEEGALRLLKELRHEFTRHEREEEDALHALDREIQIESSEEPTFGESRAPSSFRGGSRGRRRIASRWVGAAAAALILLPFLFFELRGSEPHDPAALAGSIRHEIVLNHRKNLAVEFDAEDYLGLREQMDRLDFALLRPQRFGGGELQLLGGRYCSLQGRMAAQLKLEDEEGRVLTLYQTGFGEVFEGLPEEQRELDGIPIRIWREGDLLFGLAGAGT
ncbi:MAG: hypothetical protein CL910_22100 [Deltaproteobacteria bacterium]|jgi:hypothetical protein|nr:hypothetical protein [Deltaproteobacteria bacterium]